MKYDKEEKAIIDGYEKGKMKLSTTEAGLARRDSRWRLSNG